ncbi:MAG: autotransporter-associated beta strand repeat-containing protein [Verrucomicrobia bacterium]|nr:autotransporter-associated beta strand repeat-containing protein [Verrucomicrobiota bacterium]
MMILLMAAWQVGQPLAAATLYWDADATVAGNSSTSGMGLGGSGSWNTTLANWWNGSSTDTAFTFSSGDTAIFTGLGGLVQLGTPVTLGTLIFGQNIAASGFNLTGDGTAGSNKLTLAGTAAIAVNVAGADTISAVIAGSSGLNLSSTTTGTLILTGANTYSGTTTISSGTLSIFADANLGDSANDITFNGSAAAGLMLNTPLVLGSGRTITLNNTGGAVALLSSNGTAAQVVLGKVTGAGTLAVANAGITYLLNTTNDSTGILWAQSGTISLSTLPDASGNGNIKLGAGGTTGGLQWNAGATGALTLNNRSIDLAGTTGGGTIDSSSLLAANSITINTNLVASGSGAKTLTLTGFNTGINTFAGQIVNSSSATGVNKTGLDFWALTNASNSYTGTTTATAGTLRINGAGAMGTGAISFAGGQLELRSDTSKTWGSISGLTATSTLFLDHTVGGTAAGQTITLGTVAANGTFTLNVVGDHGYNLTTGLMTVTGAKTVTLTNYLSAPGYTAAGYNPGIITIGNGTNAITTVTTGTAALVLAGYGDYVFAGDIKTSSAANIPLNITKSNLGVVVFSGNNSSWTSTTQGILNTTAGTTRIDGSTASIGGSTIGAAGGMTEVRSNTSTNWSANNLILQTASGTLVAAPQIGNSSTGNVLTLGSLTSATTGLTLSFDTNHNYGITFNGAATTAIAATTLSNIGNGVVTYAGGLTNTAAATWTITGNGDSVISGSITESGGTLALVKNGLGTLTISGAANSYSGALTLTAGILKLTTSLGTGTGNLTFNNTGSGLPNNNVIGLDLRNNGSLDFSTHGLGRSITTVFNVDNNGSGTNGTMTLGGGLSLQDSGWSDLFMGANGYSLKFASTAPVKLGVAATAVSYTTWNYIPSIAGSGKLEFAGGIAFQNTTVNSSITLAGTGDYVISGALSSSGTTGTSTVTKSGLGAVTLTADSSTLWNNALNAYTMTNGITRVTVAGGLGGASSKVNVNSGVLDLRADSGFTLTTPVTIGGSNSYFNVDRAIGGAGTGQTMTLNGVSSGAFTSYFTGGNNYSINTGTFTQTAASVLVNRIGGTGALVIPTLTGTFNAKVDGPGNTNITTAVTLATGTLTKSGTGTLTVGGPAGYAASNTNGAVTVNGGTLALDFTGLTTATNLLQSAALTLGAASAGAVSGGTLSITGAATGNTSQTLTTLAVQAGFDQIVLTPNGAGSTTLAFSGAITATNAGGQLLISAPTNSSVTIASALNTVATTGRNTVFYDGSSYNWATNTGLGTATISVTNGSAAAGVQYAEVSGTTLTTQAKNDSISSSVLNETTTGAVVTINSLRINAGSTGQTLALGANMLTLTQGGILFTGSNAYSITGTSASNGLKSATATNSDLVINNYSTSTLNIQVPIIQGTGTSTLTIGGLSTGTTVLGNAALLSTVGTYTGITYINGGTVKLATGITGFGAAASNTALTQNGGTLDLNGNNVNIGAFNGGPAATVDNTSAGAASVTIGAGNGTGTFTGTIKNTGGALSVIKTGTGAITLGDLTGAGSLAFTGDLTINTAGASGANVLTLVTALADAAGSKINLGTATAGDTVQMTYTGATNMILNNRQFDLSGQSNATITASGVNGINGTPGMLVINSDLLTDGTGAKTLTLGGSAGASSPGGGTVSGITGSGSVATINQFNGNIGNASGGGALTLTIAGTGGWSLGGNNSFTGGVNVTSTGIIRGTSANAFGGSANTINWTGAGQLDLRSDSSLNFGNAITWGGVALKINVDRAINGTGYGQVMTLGAITQTVTGQTLTVTNAVGVGTNINGTNPIAGYGLRIAGLILNAGIATTITNGIGASSTAQFAVPSAGTGVAGAFTIDGISTAASLGTHTLTIGSASNSQPVTIITGDIVQGAGTTLAILYTGNDLLTLAGQTANTNFSGGVTFNNASTATSDTNSAMTIRATTQYSLGSGAVTFAGNNFGTLEVRNDSSVTYANSIIVGNATAATNRLYVGEAINGSGGHGSLFTFGQLTFQGVTASGLTVGGISNSNNNSGDSVTFGGVSLNLAGTAAFTITNNLLLPGMLNLGNVTSTNSTAGTTQTLTIAGAGVTVVGNVTDSATATALTAITYSGTGILDLSGVTSGNTFTGGLTLNNGVTRVTNAYGLGAGTNTVMFNGGTLELRSDSNVTYNNPLQLLATGAAPAQGSGINVGQLPGGTGVNGSATPVTFTLAQLKANAAGKTIAINGIGGVASSSASVAGSSASVVFAGGIDLNGSTGGSTTITNNLALPGIVDLGNVSSSTAGAATMAVNGSGFTTLGDVSNGSGTVALTYSGTGILQVTPTATATTNYSGGLNMSGTGTLRIITNGTAANFGATTNTIALTNGTLDIRTDSSLSVVNPITVATNSVTINVDAASSGNLSNSVTFGGAATTLTTTAKALTLTSGSNYGMTFTNGFSVVTSGAAYTIANNASGTVNLGGIDFQAGTGTLTLSGSGMTVVGNVTGTAAAPTLVYSGTGFLDMTGITGGTNPFSALTLSGAGGVARANSVSNLGAAGSTVTFTSTTTAATLQIRNDNGGASDGTITFGNNIALNINNALGIIDVGNAGGLAATGNTLVFGALTNSTTANTAGTLTINGANGYGVSFTSLALSSGTTGVATTLVANAPVAITGGVSNAMTVTAAKGNTLVLDGVSTGSIAGTIADATGGSLAAGGFTAITKQGTGTWTLSGTNTNEGATTVNNGTLLINGSSAANNAYTVNGSATQGLQGMLGGTGTIGGAVTLGTNGATSFDQGSVLNAGIMGSAGTLTIGGLLTTNSFSNLSFDLSSANTVGSGVNDLISAALAPVINGNTQITINTLGTLTVGAYTLISGYSGSIANAGNFTLAGFTGVDTTHGGILINNDGSLQLFVTNATPTNAYWSGAVDGNWNSFNLTTAATNWRTSATSDTDTFALPGSTTNVHFNTTTPGATNLTTTLGSSFLINTLTFDAAATSAVTINGGTLTIDSSSSSTGITLENGAAAATINSAVVMGSAQTWTNSSATSLLTLGGNLSNGGNLLTKAGVGTITTSGIISGAGGLALTAGTFSINQQANTFTGNITVDGASTVLSVVGNTAGTYTTSNPLGNAVAGGTNFKTVTLTNGGTFSLASQNFNVNVITSTNVGAGMVFNIGTGGGKFDVASGSTLTVDDGSTNGTATTAYQLQGSGNLSKTGNGTLILRQQNSYSGTITVGAGLLQASGTTMATASAGIIVQAGAALNLAGQLLTDMEAVTISGTGLTALPAGAITNSTGTASYGGAITLAADSAVGGAGTLMTLSGIIDDAGGGFGLAKLGTGATTLSSTANTYTGTLSINGGTLTLASLSNSGSGSNGTGTIVFDNAAIAATLTYTGSGSGSMTSRGISLLSAGGAVTINSNGTGALVFKGSNTNSITGNTLLTLAGTFTGADNQMSGNLADNAGSVLSLTKSGAGKWVLSGTNTYSGATTISAGTLQFSGGTALASATAITLGGGTLSYLDDTAGAIDRTANALVLTATSTIEVGNNGGTTTGSVVRFGALTQLTAGARTLNFTSANGYSVELAGLALSPGTGQTTTLSSTTVNISIVGNVTNGMSGFTTAQFDTLALASSTTGNSISGVISDAAGGSFLPLAGGYTKITQSGGGTWRLSGQNTNTGAVAVQNGTLWLAGGDNRLNPNGGGVTLGTGTTSGKLVLGGNADGTTTAGSQLSQTLNQINATSILATSGTGTLNSVVGGAAGGTSAGTPANNSTLTLNIGAGLTDTYAGLIGWDGIGSVVFQNNINLVKSGAGTLILSGDLSNWTGTQTNTAAGTDLTIDATRPTINITGGVLRATGVLNTVVLQTGGIFDDQTTSHGVNFYLKITGGLVTSNALADNAEDVVESISHGVYAFNFNNTGTKGVSGSDMYLGAVGARIFSGSSLAAGSANTYRFGGGAPWNAVSTATLGGSGGYLQIATANVVTGGNNVIIGDNGSYGSGLGIYGGNSTVEFTAAQNYTGTTTLAGGTLVVSNSNQLGSPTTAAGSLILDGGILRYLGITTDLSNRLTLASGGTIDTNGQNVTFATGLANSNTGTSGLSNGGLTKIGTGTLTLTGASTYTGATTVSGGTLQLNKQTGSLSSSSALIIAGNGIFRFDSTGATGALSQALSSLTFSVGDGVILSQRTAAQSTTLTFQTMANRTAGATGNFTVAGTGSSASVNQVVFSTPPTTNQFLNAGLYFGGVDFAVYDATGAGYVRAINYTTDTNVGISAGGTTLGASVAGKDLQLGTAAVTAQTTVSINSLKIAGAFGITIGTGQTLTIASGGLIKTGTTATITGGTLATSGELVIRQDASTDALTIASVISSGTGIAGNVALTKSGLGTLTLTTTTSAINGQIVINGGTITVDSVNRIAGSSGITLNGGGFTISGNSTINRVFTLGLNGGTITQSSTGQDNTIGTAGDVMQFVGLGARTLTLVGGDTRVKTFAFSIGDNGGPTSLVLAGSGDSSVIRLSGANTYTGTTTINRGVLRVAALTDLPGGVGGATLTTSNTGGGNLVFNGGSSTNRAILEVTSAGGDIYRSVGTGIDQIQWLGNGGFSNQTANTTRVVNLGGAGVTLTWGAGGFVPTGSRLQLGQGGANVAAAGTIDFQNGINFGTAVRTLDIGNGSAAVDAILSGNLTFGAGGGFTMTTGIGALSLTGTNNTGVVPVTVTGGMLYFANANAILGASGTITVTHGASAPAAIGMAGSTNPLLFWNSRLAASSNGGFALDVNSSDNLDFSTGNVTNMRLTAFNPANAAVYFTGTLTPNGTTYRFGGLAPVVTTNAPSTTLVLSSKNTLTGARSVDLAPGNLTLTAVQNYTGGTVVNTTVAGAASNVGVGSDAAFGSGTVTVGGANTIAFGAVNGDRVVANRIVDAQTGTVAFVVSGDQTSDGIANNTNQGAITYAGTLDLNARAASAVLHIRTSHAAIFLGNISNSTNGITLNSSTASLFSILSTAGNGGVAKTFSGGTILGDGTTLVIDGDSSLGSSGGLTMNSSTLILQPGSGSVALSRTLTFSADDSQVIAVGAGGTLSFSGAVSGSTAPTAARTFSKNGTGMLILQGSNGTYTGNSSFANTLQVLGGALRLDGANFAAASERFFSDSATLLPVVFGAASGTLGGGGTLEIVESAGKNFALTQGFGNLTINQGAHTIALTNNNVTQALNLNLGSTGTIITRAALNGGTLNFASTTAGGTNTIGSTIANNAGGIIGGYATFNGLDWAVQSGSNSITALASGSYTTLAAASNSTTGNFILTTGTVALTTANASLNTLKLVGSAGGTNVTLNGTNALTSGGVIFDNTLGSAAISGGQLGATGSEIIVFTGGTGSTATNKLTLTAVIKGTATVLTKSGAGTLVLAGANTYTGALIINAGTVEFSNGAASQNLGAPTAGAANIILNGGVLRATATTGLIYGITLNGPAAIDLGSGVVLTQTAQGMTGVSSATGLAAGLLQKTGLGTLTLAGTTANSNLSIEIVGGVLNLGKTGVLALGETTNSNGVPYAALIVGSGAVANLTGTGGNQIGDASSVVVKSGGIFDVMGTGATVTTESIDGLAGTGTVRNTVGTLFTLTLGSNNSSSLSAYTLGATAAGVGSTGLNNFGGVIQGNIALNKIGSGTQILSGNNTYSGSTTINEGTLKLGTTNALPSGAGKGDVTLIGDSTATGVAIGGSATVLAPGTLDLGGYNQAINGLNSTTGGYVVNNPTAGAGISNTLTLGNGDANGAFNGVIMDGYAVGADSTTAVPLAYVGTINLVKLGSGTQVLSGANTFTGKTSVTGGILSISADNNLGAAPASYVADQLTLDGGTLQSTATLVIASTRGITVGTGGGTFDTAVGTTTTINSVIVGSGTIVKTGAGTLIFTAVNTYTGKTSIQQGSVSVASINSVATPAQSAGSNLGTPSNAANGTIDLGATTNSGALVYTGTGETTDRVINLAGTTGGGTLDQSGTGVVKFTSNLTAMGVGSKVLTLKGSTAGTGEISGAIVDNGGANTTGVTKEGTGTWVLSGTNTYTGATTVNGGTLQVGASGTGSIGSSAVTVNSTATLSGSGTIAGSTIIGSGGILAPGDGNPSTSNTTLTFSATTASLTVADTGTIQLGLTTADSTDSGFATWFHANPGGTAADYVASIGGIANTGSGTSWNDVHSGGHDFISAADTIALGSTSTTDKRVVVSLNNLSGVTYGSVFNLMDWSTLGLTHDDSALSTMGAFSAANNLQLQDLTSFSTGLAWDTSLFDNYGILVVVPEPGRMLFLMLGLLGLLSRRRRFVA